MQQFPVKSVLELNHSFSLGNLKRVLKTKAIVSKLSYVSILEIDFGESDPDGKLLLLGYPPHHGSSYHI